MRPTHGSGETRLAHGARSRARACEPQHNNGHWTARHGAWVQLHGTPRCGT